MTKPGNEEPGVIARQSSNCSTGVPIKKRRFPLVWPPPSPPEESPAVTAETENNLPEPNLCQVPFLRNAIVAAESPGLSDAKNDSFPEEEMDCSDTDGNLLQKNVKFSRVEPEKSGLSNCSTSLVNLQSTTDFMPPPKSVCDNNLTMTEQPGDVKLTGMQDTLLKPKNEGDCNLELSITGNAEFSFVAEEPYRPALAGENNDEGCELPLALCPPPTCQLSSKGRTVIQHESGDGSSKYRNFHLHANRSNWDLNTTMDNWESSVSDAMAGQGTLSINETSQTSSSHDMEQRINSTGPVGIGINLGKQIVGDGEGSSSLNSAFIHKSDDSLCLRLSTSPMQSYISGESSSVLAKIDPVRVLPNNLVGLMMPVGEMPVKSEVCHQNLRHDVVGDKRTCLRLSDFSSVKNEVVEKYGPEVSTQKLVEHRPVKSEPVQEAIQEMREITEETLSQSDGKVVKCQDNCSSKTMSSTFKKFCPLLLSSCSSERSLREDMSFQLEHSTCGKEVDTNTEVYEEACCSQISEKVALSAEREGESKTSLASNDATVSTRAEERKLDDSETCKLKLVDEISRDSRGNGEGSVSDDEKINLTADMLDEDSYGTDCESDEYHASGFPMDREDMYDREDDDDYEDGEVREPVDSTGEGSAGEKDLKNANFSNFDDNNVHSFGLRDDGDIAQKFAVEIVKNIEDCGKTSDEHVKECVSTVLSEKPDQGVNIDGFLQESPTRKEVVSKADVRSTVMVSQRKLFDRPGMDEVHLETEASCDGASDGSHGTVTVLSQVADGTAGENFDSTLPKTEASSANAAKDGSCGGNRSRIINLARATNVSSPCKTRSIPGQFSSRIERDKFTDYNGEKLHLRGNRDEIYVDGPRKFFRERFHDQRPRNPRMNFMRGRGRISCRSDSLHGDWKPDHEMNSDIYNAPSDYRFRRHRRAPDDSDSEFKCNGYLYTADGAMDADRGGRKPMDDGLPSFRHTSSRQHSPGSRDGSTTRGVQMGRRFPRNDSPSRCVGEDDSDMVGLRHGEKFIRGLPDDMVEPSFITHSRPPYEEMDGQFVRAKRTFSSFRRRGGHPHQIRSRSPMRSNMRPLGPWSSPPRRKSSDGFNEAPELANRRSPPVYRNNVRMRSPDRGARFPEEIVGRRRGSSPYMPRFSNDTRDMDSGRGDHSHPRSVIPNRSPSDRSLPRGTRRFDNNDEMFRDGPPRFGRFHEQQLGDENGEERRKFGERRVGHFRSYNNRPFYNNNNNNGGDDGNFCSSHGEDAPPPRPPLRFCPPDEGGEPEFLERSNSNLREREFERRIKNRLVNNNNAPPGRARNNNMGEEQDGNFRHNGGQQVWHDDDRFVDNNNNNTQGKRRRL